MGQFEKPTVSDYTLLSLRAGVYRRLKALWFLEIRQRSQHFFTVNQAPGVWIKNDVIPGGEFPVVDMSADLKSEATVPEPDESTMGTDVNAQTSDANQQLQEIWGKVSGVLGNLPDYVTDFFKEYQRPLITVGLILGAVVSVKLLLAILGAVNEIPLLSPTFEVVGLGYSGWFVYRFLLRDANRQELMGNLVSLRDQILGKRG